MLKLLEKLRINRLRPIIKRTQLIPDHEFAFMQKHDTAKQIHIVAIKIGRDIENREFYTAIFTYTTKV